MTGDGLAGAWAAVTARIAALPDLLGPAPTDHEDAERHRYALRFLAAGIRVCVELDDTEAPELGRSIEHRMTWGLDNPDTLYGYTRLDGRGAYRIRGRRGSARHLELQVNTGHQGDGDFAGWRAVCAANADELTVGPEGELDVVLAPDRPSGGGDWLALDDTAGFLHVRQYFSDWEHEEPAHLTIERLDVPLPPAPLTTDDLEARLALLAGWLEVGARCWRDLSAGFVDGRPGEVQPFLPPAEASGLKGQAYGMGPWRCGPDDAVVLELEPPACRMWGVSLCDRWWQSIDFAERQSSLNDSQATTGPGDRVVIVISHDDPGVANWLDPGGNTAGTLALRYLRPDTVPAMSYRRVARSDLDAALPAGVPQIAPSTRQQVLRARKAAVARRFGRP